MARGMQEPLLSDGGDVEVGIGIRNDWAVERPAIAKVAPSRSPAEANRSPKDPLRRMHLQGNDMGAAWRLKVAGEESARRFSIMLVLSTGFLIAELVFGVLSGSLALMADAFHMISDVVAIVCGMWVARLSSRASSDEMSFGWRRAEIVGAFANGCFLLAVSFTIALEAIEKLAGLSGDSKNLEKNAFQKLAGISGDSTNILEKNALQEVASKFGTFLR
ncbi:cation efflux family-domain-containing protein [Baffinella frigidus]|nr:cation efflux family-domain-containing protein [Cryptophyta sp. CCMP2293]